MRYLYRSYCLKEGGIWSGGEGHRDGEQTNQRGTKQKARKVGNLIKKAEGGMSQEV